MSCIEPPLVPLPDLPGKVHEVRTCSVPRCEKKHVGHSYCGMHLYRWRRHGDPGEAERRQAPPLNGATCSIAGCSEPAQSRGWCNKHWLRWRRNGDHVAHALGLTVLPIDQCEAAS